MKQILIKLSIITLLITACSKPKSVINVDKNITFSYPKTEIPKEDTKLWIADGDSTKQTVAIFLQGGPKDVLNFEKKKKSVWRYLPDYEDYYRIHLHQAQTLNPGIFTSESEFTMDMARVEVDNTSEILYRAIKHFKAKGKKVLVISHSYGAFIIPHYLATRPSLADKYVIISGRIDDPKESVEAHSKGFNGTFKNGKTFITDEGIKDFSEYNKWAKLYYRGKQLIKGAIGEVPYSTALKSVDLSNVIYIYSAIDERVGGLTKSEIDFLNSKNVQVFESEREHGHTWKDLIDLIKNGKIKL